MNKGSWIVKVFMLSFFLALIFGGMLNFFASKMHFIFLIVITILISIIGIVFDMIGTSVLTANESTFHAKASKKVKGAREAVNLIKNSSKVANFCNDIVGDVCGIISGGLGTVLALNIANALNIKSTIVTIIICALVSSITVGGKAIGKHISAKHADNILFKYAKVCHFFHIK